MTLNWLKALLNEDVWLKNTDINNFLFAIKKENGDKCLGNIGVLGTFLFQSLRDTYDFWVSNDHGIEKFQYPASWLNLINGKGSEKSVCPFWWQLSHVSRLKFKHVMIHFIEMNIY